MHNRVQIAGTDFSNLILTCKKFEAFRIFFQANGKDQTNITMGVSPAQ